MLRSLFDLEARWAVSPAAGDRYPAPASHWNCAHCSTGGVTSVWLSPVRSFICRRSVVGQSIRDRMSWCSTRSRLMARVLVTAMRSGWAARYESRPLSRIGALKDFSGLAQRSGDGGPLASCGGCLSGGVDGPSGHGCVLRPICRPGDEGCAGRRGCTLVVRSTTRGVGKR
jgi:hypothetical protein